MRVHSRQPGTDTLITDIDATGQLGPSADGDLALSGRAVWRSAVAQFTGRLARPRAVLDGGTSALAFQVTSTIGSFSASGEVSGGTQRQFTGRIAASSNSVPRLFATLELPAPWLNVQRAVLTGDALAKNGEVSLSGSSLRLDDTSFEGTLGFHADGKRGLIEGTLATNFLDLGRLAGRSVAAATNLYRAPVAADLFPTNIDLRVSASTVRWGEVEVNDFALSAFSHDNRVEVMLDEANAFSGVAKAHAVASLGTAGIEAHADLAVTNVDLGPLTLAITGQERASGALAGKVAVEGRGRSLSDMVHSLSGTGQASVERGNFMGLSVSQALKRFARKLPMGEGQAAQITSFDSAKAGISVENGVINVVDGRVIGPGIQLSFGGHTDLPQGKIDIVAVATQTDAAGSLIPNGPRLPFEMRGVWGEPFTLVDRSRALALPNLPMLGTDRVFP